MTTFLKYIFGNSEMIIWILAIILLALNDPFTEPKTSLCILKNIGFPNCWGCGLGKSMSFLLRGEVVKSFDAHFMGIPASGVLLFRICDLFSRSFQVNQILQFIKQKNQN